ncbi:MAG: S41 family peptidase, partial [Planctomycetota bacterium]
MKKWLGIAFLFFITFPTHPFVSFGQNKPPESSRVETQEPGKNPVKEKAVYEEFEELIRIVNELQGKYVDEVTLNTILTNAYRGMLSGLDPYSQYFGEEELADLKVETEGEFEGLGIEVVMKDGFLVVITPMLDSPAFKAGILVGDKIIKIDGASTENMSIRDVIKRLRGKAGVKITLTVFHEGDVTPVNITIERATIHVNSTRGAKIVEDTYKIGYIAIINFQENTVKDMDAAIQNLMKQGMKSLILDLRFNPGGLLNVAIDMADKFLEKGVIVSTRGRDKTQNYV